MMFKVKLSPEIIERLRQLTAEQPQRTKELLKVQIEAMKADISGKSQEGWRELQRQHARRKPIYHRTAPPKGGRWPSTITENLDVIEETLRDAWDRGLNESETTNE